MRNFYPEEIASILCGNIITRSNGRTAQIFTKQPEDEPLCDSFHFLFNGCKNEDKLIDEMRQNNAAGIVIREHHNLNINKWEEARICVIEVPHMTGPYIELAKIYRSQFHIPFIEVIGSAGKTTTKEMIGAVLKEKIPALVSISNYNSPSQIAYNIFRLRDNHKAAILEASMKGQGIIEFSSKIIKPDIAVLTSIQRAHLVEMGSIENIISEKAGILKCLSKKGTLIVNGEDRNCRRFPIERYMGKVLKFGFSDKFDIYASGVSYRNLKAYFKAAGRGFHMDCVLNTVGRYNVSNALAAILTCKELGLKPREIAMGLSKFKPLRGRLKLYKGINNTILVDDNFDANPDSTKSLIQEIPQFAKGRPVILVMGDMESSDENISNYARKIHFMIGQQISGIKLRHLVAIGKWAEEYVNGALSQGVPSENTAYFKTVEEAKEHIFDYLAPGSIIIFKASKNTRVSDLVKPLKVN